MNALSQALSSGNEEVALNIGVGMAPKTQETMRRKSVSSKAKEVVTIGSLVPLGFSSRADS